MERNLKAVLVKVKDDKLDLIWDVTKIVWALRVQTPCVILNNLLVQLLRGFLVVLRKYSKNSESR